MNPINITFDKLSLEQQYAYYHFVKKNNLFITGPGGTGKTKLIHSLVQYCVDNNKRLQVCAMTGCAAILLNCNARTIHSWSGMKLARGTKDKVIKDIYSNSNAKKNWLKTDVLIVDEVSMMSQKIFEILEESARIIRKNSLPFGGMQVVFTGDFFQLPPVGNMNEPESEKMCFESPIWTKVFKLQHHIQLKTIFRQTDPTYTNILSEVRKGTLSPESLEILNKYVSREYKKEEHNDCVPIKLYPIRSKVDFLNSQMYNSIEHQEYEYPHSIQTDNLVYVDTGKFIPVEIIMKCRNATRMEIEREIEYLTKNMNCQEILKFKVGCNVMCTTNLDIDSGICNGSQGVIIDFVKKIVDSREIVLPLVKFSNGVIKTVKMVHYQSEEYPTIVLYQMPLQLSWALTIHKIQGATIAMGEIDIGKSIFEYGQIYVALSRIQSLEGLYLMSFHPHKIKANPKVIGFYNELRDINIESDSDFMCYRESFERIPEEIEENPNIKTFRIEDAQSNSSNSCSSAPERDRLNENWCKKISVYKQKETIVTPPIEEDPTVKKIVIGGNNVFNRFNYNG